LAGADSNCTLRQSISSSSAINIGSEVVMPWPISALGIIIVAESSGAMRNQGVSLG
jgi:hypothetical protein